MGRVGEQGLSADSAPLLSSSASLPAGPSSMSHVSPASPCTSLASLPAAGQLSELAEEKLREVFELHGRCKKVQSAEERLEAATLLTAAREELRLLREYAGLDPAVIDPASIIK